MSTRGLLPVPRLHRTSDGLRRFRHRYSVQALDYIITIAAGFCTDGDSVPTWARWILNQPFNILMLPAVVVHDAMYASHAVPRHIADRMYLQLALANGYDPVKAYIKYTVLVLFGWWRWHRTRQRAMLIGSKFVHVTPCGVV